MALLASRFRMFPLQLEPRFIMVKIRHRPAVEAVAAGTVRQAIPFRG